MKVLVVVPARAGSKRVPGKNLRKLGGKELVARSLEAALGARSASRVVLSSDGVDVLAVGRRYDQVKVLMRPAALATDTALAIDFVRHAVDSEREAGATYDAIVIVQPSSPLTLSADIDGTVEVLGKHPEADSAVSVMRLDHALHPAKLKRLDGDKLIGYLEDEQGRTASHQLPELYVRNGSVYASRVRTIDSGSILGQDSRAFVMPRERSIDINDELDWQLACFLFERGTNS